MDSISPYVVHVDMDIQQPEPSPEDKIVSSYLEVRSEVYRDLVKVRNDVSKSKAYHELAPVY